MGQTTVLEVARNGQEVSFRPGSQHYHVGAWGVSLATTASGVGYLGSYEPQR